MKRYLTVSFGLALVLFILLTRVVFAQTPDTSIQLLRIKHSILTIQELEKQQLITPAEAEKSITYYVAQASQVAGHPMILQQILAIPDASSQSLTPLQEFAGAINFLNVMMALATIALGGALIYLFRHYVQKLYHLLATVPVIVYEVVFYLASLGGVIGGWFLPSPLHQYLALLACVLYPGALAFSASHRRILAHVFILSLLLFVVWAPIALIFNNALIGFLAIGALLSALGFNILSEELFHLLHARMRRSYSMMVENITLGGFVILTIFVVIHLSATLIPILGVFEFGALFLGGLAGYGGLLGLSSRGYWGREDAKTRRRRYWGFQFVALVAGLGAIFFGSVFQIDVLQKIGGTFFVVYCIIRIAEIPTRSRPAFAMLIAVLCVLTIGFCWFALIHADLFRQWLFLPG